MIAATTKSKISETIEAKIPAIVKAPFRAPMQFKVERTDTFGGEANYSWCERKMITVPDGATSRSIVTAAKKAIGFTGVKCDREDWGDFIILRPRGMCQIIFIELVQAPLTDSIE